MDFDRASVGLSDVESFLNGSDIYSKKYLKIEMVINRMEDELCKDVESKTISTFNNHLHSLSLQVSKFQVLKREIYKSETKCRLEIEIPEFCKEYQRVRVLSTIINAATVLWGSDFYSAEYYDLEIRHLDVQFSSEHTGLFTDHETDFLLPEIKEEIEKEVNKALLKHDLHIAFFDGRGSLIGDYTLEHGFYIVIPETYENNDIEGVIKTIHEAIEKVLPIDLISVYSYDYYRDENYESDE